MIYFDFCFERTFIHNLFLLADFDKILKMALGKLVSEFYHA